MKYFLNYILIALLALGLACGADDHGHDHEEVDAHGHDHEAGAEDAHGDEEAEHGENEVELTAIQMQKIGLKTAKIQGRNLQDVLKANGYLELPPQNKAEVSSMATGNVSQILVTPGARVRKGQTLARLQHPDLIMLQQEYMEALSRRDLLAQNYARQEALSREQITAQKTFQQTQSDYAITKSRVLALQKRLQLIGLNATKIEAGEMFSSVPVRSPISGFIREIHINIGKHISPEDVLFEIVDNHHIHIDLLVYEKDLPAIRLNQEMRFWLQNDPGREYQAKVFAIGKAVEEDQKAVRVHAEITNQGEGLLPGMYVEARINTGERSVPSLPEAALVTDKALRYIFVKEETEGEHTHFRKVQVLSTASDGGFVAIDPLEAIDPDAEVVIEGAFFLMSQTKISEGGVSHEH